MRIAKLRIRNGMIELWLIPVAVRSKEQVCGRSIAGIAG